MTCRTDCGRCIDCIETDDYAPTWRNPRFQAATSADAPLALDVLPPPMGRDGGEVDAH